MLEWYRTRTRPRPVGLFLSTAAHAALALALTADTGSRSPTRPRYHPPPNASGSVERLSYVTVAPPMRSHAGPGAEAAPGISDSQGMEPSIPELRRLDRAALALSPRIVPLQGIEFGPTVPTATPEPFTSLELVEDEVRLESSVPPRYPSELRRRRIEGEVKVRFVVDTTGMADVGSASVLHASHAEFAAAVMAALPGMKFTPARLGGLAIPHAVTQSFSFRIGRRYSTSAP